MNTNEKQAADELNQVRRFRTKPVEKQAMRFAEDGSNWKEVLLFMGRRIPQAASTFYVEIDTLEGSMMAKRGDWIIRGVAGEFYPCKPDIFKESYEPVDPLDSRRVDEEIEAVLPRRLERLSSSYLQYLIKHGLVMIEMAQPIKLHGLEPPHDCTCHPWAGAAK